MNVNLTPELEALVQRKVESGLYNNQSEVVREALRLLAEQDRLREVHLTKVRRTLSQGLKRGDRGSLDGSADGADTQPSNRRRKKSNKKAG